MKNCCFYLTVLLIILTIGGCCRDQTHNGGGETESGKLYRFFAQEHEWFLENEPEWAFYLGEERKPGQLGDHSLQGVSRNRQHWLEGLEKLESLDVSQLSKEDMLYYRLYKSKLQMNLEGLTYKDYLRPVNQMEGIHLNIIVLPSLSVFRTEKNYRDYLSRLGQVPRVVDETIAVMREGVQQKITPARVAVGVVDKQIASLITEDPVKSMLYMPFEKIPPGIDSSTADLLREQARAVIMEKVVPSFKRFRVFWNRDYFPNCTDDVGLSSLPNGSRWYQYLIKFHTTTDMTAEEIHGMGLKEVARIRKEMETIVKETGFKGNFKDFVRFLKTDPRFYYNSAPDLLTGYRDLCKRIDAKMPEIIKTLPRLSYGVREITEAEAAGLPAYCDLGSLKQGRASNLAISTHDLKAIKIYQMEALTLHEMAPGHHIQLSLANEMESVPAFRSYDYYNAYIEGWALYSEKLGEEMGLYTDPYSRFGRLDLNMWRAIRLVVDTGIHVKGWNRQQAIDYFKQNSSLSNDVIRTEVARYIVDPGQALAYKVGEREFLRLRKLAENQLGKDFDIRELHDRMLEDGALPLKFLSAKIEGYIAAKKKSAAKDTKKSEGKET